MDFSEFGDRLRQERERQGLSLRDVADKTKVSRRCLEAIEQGRRCDLPHAVYAKGFVRHYGRFLGVDEGMVEDVLSEHFTIDDEPEFHRYEVNESIAKVRPAPGAPSRPAAAPAVVLVALLVILCGLLGYLYFSPAGTQFKSFLFTRVFQKSEPAPEISSPAEQRSSEQKAQKDIAKEAAKPAPVESKEAVAPMRPVESRPAEAEPQAARKEQAPEPPAQTAQRAEPAPAAPAQAGAPMAAPVKASEEKDFGSAGPLLVEILANQACWIEASVDGGQNKEFYLNKGQFLTTRFKDKMTVKLGNAGGVTVRFNGKDVPVSAPRSGVVTLQFP